VLQTPDVQTRKGRGDKAILALMFGCGLRRGEVADLRINHLQQREEHWVLADLVGQAAPLRTVPVPEGVKSAIDLWVTAAPITEGRRFRCVSRKGSVWGDGITEKVIWHMVKSYAATAGIPSCRRTCAHLCAPVPRRRWRAGADPIPAGACFGRDDGAIPRMQAAAPRCRE